MKIALTQFVIIGLAALILGFSGNALRGKSALQLSKNYFDTGADLIAQAKRAAHQSAPAGSSPLRDDTGVEPVISIGTSTTNSVAPSAAQPKGGGHLEHDYQTILFDEIVEVLNDPMTQAGLNVIVDARNEQAFLDGHIPGAMLCNPYEVANYIDNDVGGQSLLDSVLNAEKVIVYCGGGECADSIFMSRELLELDVPYSAIYLYEGGWNDWTANGGAVVKGMD